MHEVDRRQLDVGGAGVVAADLQQVGQQRLEPLDLGVQQLGGAGAGRIEVAAVVVEHVAGEPDGGQRGPELMRHVGDEALLHLGEPGQLHDLALQAVGHPVERPREGRDHVLAALGDALFELPGRQLAAGLRRDADRAR